MKRVLVVDSEQENRTLLRSRLETDGYDVVECDAASTTLDFFRLGADAVVVSRPGDTPAVELLHALRAINPQTPAIMVSTSADETLEALRHGAYYVTRAPLSPDEASILLGRAFKGRADTSRPPVSTRELAPATAALIGETPDIKAIREAIRRLAARPTTTVLILGESGAGKQSVAHTLHVQTNQGGPFVHLSSLASSDASLEAELFGFEGPNGEVRPGLLEQADGGTLFLGEITDIPLSLQTKLLRFVQERAFRRVGAVSDSVSQARVVATSSRNLDSAVRDGLLRPELAYRLAVVTLEVPPLRDRRADIPLLVEHFLGSLAGQSGSKIRGLTDAAMKRLLDYSWPGNVRELFNVIERAALLTDSERLDVAHLPQLSESRPGLDYRLPSQGIDFRELEREVLSQALRLASGNQTRAASLLGLTRDQIRYRMAKFGMTSRDLGRANERAA